MRIRLLHGARLASVALRDPEGYRLARRIVAQRLTFLDIDALLDLRSRVRHIEEAQVGGTFIEAGCALGGSAIMITASKSPGREFALHDVFGLIPPPSEVDGVEVRERYEVITAGEAEGFDGDTYYGYQDDLKGRVAESFTRFELPVGEHAVTLVEGLFADTLKPAEPVAFAHLDCDWYESVKVCLNRIWPALSPGGAIVVDDYEAWHGCRVAVDEFLRDHPECRVEHRARVHLIKPKP